MYASVKQGFFVAVVAIEKALQLSGHTGTTQRHRALDLAGIGDGHNTGFDGYGYSGFFSLVTKSVKLVVIKK